MYRYERVAGVVSTRLRTTFWRESERGVNLASLNDAVTDDL
jgi:hypothetical protein